MNVLFVCTMNAARSVAAERMYRGTPGMSVRSAGIDARARYVVMAADVEWADRIVVFEDAHRQHILRFCGPRPGSMDPENDAAVAAIDAKIVDIGIPDAFGANDRGLVTELRELLTELLGPPGR